MRGGAGAAEFSSNIALPLTCSARQAGLRFPLPVNGAREERYSSGSVVNISG